MPPRARETTRPTLVMNLAGLSPSPFPRSRFAAWWVHDKLIALAEAIFDTENIRIYASELWAKYSGAASYEQEHHRDYPNHTPLVPVRGRPALARPGDVHLAE
jgi:hypothetical protein